MELKSIKGLGPKGVENLKNLNIYTVEDLVSFYPYKHNLIVLDDIKNAVDKQNIIIECIIDSVPLVRRFRANMNSLTFRAVSNRKMLTIMIFNRAFLKNNLHPGKIITVFGKYDALKNTVIASDIKLEKIESGSIESIYHLTNGITSKQLKKYINEALVNLIHNPKNQNDVKKALLKLKYEELFEFMFKINYLKELNKKSQIDYVRNVDINRINDFIRGLPFELTTDQNKAIEEIYKDMTSDKRMNRLLQGDVGSGKTIVSIIAAYINYLSSQQTALMAPTEVLAYQHFENVKSLLESTNMKVELLVGSMKKREKDEIFRACYYR